MGLWAGSWSPGQGSQSYFEFSWRSTFPVFRHCRPGSQGPGEDPGRCTAVCVSVCVPDYATCVGPGVLLTLCIHRCGWDSSVCALNASVCPCPWDPSCSDHIISQSPAPYVEVQWVCVLWVFFLGSPVSVALSLYCVWVYICRGHCVFSFLLSGIIRVINVALVQAQDFPRSRVQFTMWP